MASSSHKVCGHAMRRRNRFQVRVIDRREVAVDVAAQYVAVTVAPAFVARDGAMRALALAVGVAVIDEAALEQRVITEQTA